MARWQTWLLLQPNVKPQSLKLPTDLMIFDWEEQKEKQNLTELNSIGAFDIFPKTLENE
jgi:hypothetical protein